MFRDEVGWGVKNKSGFGCSSLIEFADYSLTLSEFLGTSVPILDGSNWWLTVKYFVCQDVVVFFYLRFGLSLLDAEVALGDKGMVISSVTLLLNFCVLIAQDIGETVD